MTCFTADWLSAREPVDARSRSTRLALAAAFQLPDDREILALDIGTGTGSNMRHLIDYLPHSQEWLAVDHDAGLLGGLRPGMRAWASLRGYELTEHTDHILLCGRHRRCRIATERVDLADALAEGLFADRHLVTTSALLDLVSEPWLEALVARCRENGSVVLFTLTYDGRISCSPPDEDDEMVRSLVNRHQRTDKGFGPALGPQAADVGQAILTAAGYFARREASDWVLSSDASGVQRMLIDGWTEAAIQVDPAEELRIRAWHERRTRHVDTSQSCIVVGHADLAAWMPR